MSSRQHTSILGLLPENRFWFLAAPLFVLKQIPIWLTPLLVCAVINAAVSGPDGTGRIIPLCAGMVVLLLVGAVAGQSLGRVVSANARAEERRLRMALVKKLHELSLSSHDDLSAGALYTKVLSDIATIHAFRSQALVGSLEIVCMAVAALVMPLLAGKGVVTAVYLLAAPPILVLLRLSQGRFQEDIRAYRQSVERMSSRFGEMLAMIPLARAHAVEDMETAILVEKVDEAALHGRRLDARLARYGISIGLTMQTTFVLTLAVAGFLATHNTISVGEITMSCTYFMLLLGAVSALMGQYPSIVSAVEALRGVDDVLDCPDVEMNDGRTAVESVRGNIRFDDVSFSYSPDKVPSVSGLSLEVHPGETIAVVGESGAGKSTLMGLIIGFRHPTCGRIFLDGVDMATLDLRTFRRFLSLVPQNVVLHSGSVRENILFGLVDVSNDRLDAAIRMANVAEFVELLPSGLDTEIGENGAKLSGGQRQRIAIARALVRNPKVLILDEAASSLDAVSESLVREAIKKAACGRTTFIVAHCLSAVRNADRIVVMKHGKIIETGGYDELVCRDSEFTRIFHAQRHGEQGLTDTVLPVTGYDLAPDA